MQVSFSASFIALAILVSDAMGESHTVVLINK